VSLHGYHVSLELSRQDVPFYALIMAAIRKADTSNTAKLKAAWPEVYAEFSIRYNAPGGLLQSEEA